jgi:hypothetical protein
MTRVTQCWLRLAREVLEKHFFKLKSDCQDSDYDPAGEVRHASK